MLRSCIEDCDIHGLKHAVRPDYKLPRRIVWLIVVLVATSGFVTFASFRITYYFTYPYVVTSDVEEDSFLIPALSICATPPYDSGQFPKLSLSKWEGDNLSDQEAIELAWLHYGINISTIDVHTGELILDQQAMGTLRDYYTYGRRNESIKSVFAQEIPKDQIETDIVVRRLMRLTNGFRVKLTRENFYRNYGLRLDDVSCVRVQGFREIGDCKPLMYRAFTEIGPCIVLDTVVTNAKESKKQFNASFLSMNWGDYFLLVLNISTLNISQWHLEGMVYNPGGNPSWNFQHVSFFSLKQVAATALYVEKFLEIRNLEKPYKKRSCVKDSETVCIHKCLAVSKNCSLIDYVDNFGYLPCRLDEQMFDLPWLGFFHALEKCLKRCKYTCVSNEFKIGTGDHVDYAGTKHSTIALNLVASTSLVHNVVREQPLYTYDSLLSELGGMLGLFIGASLLTLAHGIQFLCHVIRLCAVKMTRLWRSVTRKRIAMDLDSSGPQESCEEITTLQLPES